MADIINFLSSYTLLIIVLGYIFAVWFGLTIWAAIDISRRTDNWLYRLAMVFLVAIGFFVGFAFYLMIRPSLTRDEIASQRLEEKFFAATAAYAFCKNCGEPVASEFNYCVNCGFELRKTCSNCNYQLMAGWLACPNCGKLQGPEVLPEGTVQEASIQGNSRFLLIPDWVGALLRGVRRSSSSGEKPNKKPTTKTKTNVRKKATKRSKKAHRSNRPTQR